MSLDRSLLTIRSSTWVGELRVGRYATLTVDDWEVRIAEDAEHQVKPPSEIVDADLSVKLICIHVTQNERAYLGELRDDERSHPVGSGSGCGTSSSPAE